MSVECENDEFADGQSCSKCDIACETCEGPTASLNANGCLKCSKGYKKDDKGNCSTCIGYI